MTKAAKSTTTTPSFIIWLSLLAAIGGFLFGYDTGVISGAMILLVKKFPELDSVWQELVVSVTVGAAAVFALCGGFMTERFGRRPVILTASFVFSVGAIVMGAANGKIMLIVGRFTVGAGIGLSSMAVPMFIAESSPTHLRGRLVTMNNLFITGGQFVASLLDGGLSYVPDGWRWLIKHSNYARAQQVLERIHGSPVVAQEELQQIRQTFDEEKQQDTGGNVFLKMIRTPYLRRTLFLGCALQLFQQVTGINTIMYYSATIVEMAGVKNEHDEIWLAAAAAAVNFVCTFIGLYLVERIGRRPLTLISLAGVTLALLTLGIGFQIMALKSPSISKFQRDWPMSKCDAAVSCDACITTADCGFCFDMSSTPINGSCLLFNETTESIFGACDHKLSETTSVTWATNWCPTDYAWVIILGLAFYLFCFAPGMGPMPWTINAEIYPQWARSTGNACSTATNWIFNLIVSMTFLSLLNSITKQGAYYLYTGIGMVGLLFFWWVLPETKGKSLEEVEGLFSRPWFCGRNKLHHHQEIEYVRISLLRESNLTSSSDEVSE